jgi:rhodanese-related sulfurtransferase
LVVNEMAYYFKNKGLLIAGMVHLSGKEALAELRNGALLVDLRMPIETDYKKFDVPEVLYIPAPEFNARQGELPKDRPMIIADSVGLGSKAAVRDLTARGFANAANLNGGILDWERDGMPIKIDNSKKLSGSCTCRLKPQGK